MLARAFVSICIKMLMTGVRQCEKILINADRINNDSNMDLPWLVSILYSLYQQLALVVEQTRRFYQFLASGEFRYINLRNYDRAKPSCILN